MNTPFGNLVACAIKIDLVLYVGRYTYFYMSSDFVVFLLSSGPLVVSETETVVKHQFGECACVRPSEFVRATFMHEFQNNVAQLLSLSSRSAISNIYSDRLKGKVTLECQMIKWSKLSFAGP